MHWNPNQAAYSMPFDFHSFRNTHYILVLHPVAILNKVPYFIHFEQQTKDASQLRSCARFHGYGVQPGFFHYLEHLDRISWNLSTLLCQTSNHLTDHVEEDIHFISPFIHYRFVQSEVEVLSKMKIGIL